MPQAIIILSSVLVQSWVIIGCRTFNRRLQNKLLIMDALSSSGLLACWRRFLCIFSRKLKIIASLRKCFNYFSTKKTAIEKTGETLGVLLQVRIAKWWFMIIRVCRLYLSKNERLLDRIMEF